MTTHLSEVQLDELRAELERQLKKLKRSMRTTDRVMRPVQLDQSAVGRQSRIDNLQTQCLTAGLPDLPQRVGGTSSIGQVADRTTREVMLPMKARPMAP